MQDAESPLLPRALISFAEIIETGIERNDDARNFPRIVSPRIIVSILVYLRVSLDATQSEELIVQSSN